MKSDLIISEDAMITIYQHLQAAGSPMIEYTDDHQKNTANALKATQYHVAEALKVFESLPAWETFKHRFSEAE